MYRIFISLFDRGKTNVNFVYVNKHTMFTSTPFLVPDHAITQIQATTIVGSSVFDRTSFSSCLSIYSSLAVRAIAKQTE